MRMLLGGVAVALALQSLLSGCEVDEQIAQSQSRYEQETALGPPILARVCASGTRIYKSRVDGKYYDTLPWSNYAYEVEDVSKVCDGALIRR